MYVVRHWEALQDVTKHPLPFTIWGHLTKVIVKMLIDVLIIINYANFNKF